MDQRSTSPSWMPAALRVARGLRAITPIETVVRGVMLTEEMRHSPPGLEPEQAETVIQGLPQSDHFGAGQIVNSKIDLINSSRRDLAYDDLDSLRRDLEAPLRNVERLTALKEHIGRSPKKVFPAGDRDLRVLLDHPRSSRRADR